MSWIEAGLVSALSLGVYDICFKHAIQGNAVLPVLFLSTLTGAAVWAALLLVQAAHPGLLPAVQAWFSIYLVVLFVPFAIGWQRRWWERNEFRWRWTITAIAFSLLAAVYIHFGALRRPGALVSVVMSLRRGNTLVAFAGGLLLFGERSHWQKIVAVLGILTGIVLTVVG